MKKIRCRRLIAAAVAVILLITLDQISKQFLSQYLNSHGDLVLIPGIFRLTYVENYGAAFGSLQNSTAFLVVSTCILMIYLLIIYFRLLSQPGHRLMRVICICIVSGGVGNLLDRAIRGYVIDFFYFELIRFPVFNLADCYITCGIAVLVVGIFTFYRDEDLDLLLPFGRQKERKGEDK